MPEFTETENQDEQKTFTQAEVDEILRKRLARAKSVPADYEELKAKAQKFDEAENANKTELQKANEALEKLKKEVEEKDRAEKTRKLYSDVSKKTGVPDYLLHGDDEETVTEFANAILEFVKKNKQPKNDHAGEFSRPKENNDDLAQYAKQLLPKNE